VSEAGASATHCGGSRLEVGVPGVTDKFYQWNATFLEILIEYI